MQKKQNNQKEPPKEPPKSITYAQWMKKQFVQNKPICSKNNEASFICTDKQCNKQSPFVCAIKGCECIQKHKACSIRNIQYFLQEMQKSQITKPICSKLETTVHRLFNNLIQAISIEREKILKDLKKGQVRQSLKNHLQGTNKLLNELLTKNLSGSVLYEMLNPFFGGSKENQTWLSKFQEEYAENFRFFQQNKLKPFFIMLKSKIFQEAKNISWSQNLYNQSIQFGYNSITYSSYSNTDLKIHKIAMLNTGISKFAGNIIKWKIKILKISFDQNNNSSWVSLGIGLRQSLKAKNFQLNDEKNDDCYMISNSEISYSALDFERNNKPYGIKFQKDDIIQMQLDTMNWIIKFKNLTTLQSTELKIKRIPELNIDQYHICVGLTSNGDSVQIISPIETSLQNYRI